MSWLKAVPFLILGIPIGLWLSAFDFEFVGSHLPGKSNVEFGFAELASIALTAATVALGCVALVVAVAAFLDFSPFVQNL